MPSQKLHRLPGGLYALVDAGLVLLCTPATSCGNVELIGLAFKTRSSGWRLLRRGLVDIGFSPLPELAIQRLMADAEDLPEAVKKAMPV